MGEKPSKEQPSEDKNNGTDRWLTTKDVLKMLHNGENIKTHLDELLRRGFIIKREETKTPGLYRITIRDPFTDQIVFYEDEEVLFGEGGDLDILSRDQ